MNSARTWNYAILVLILVPLIMCFVVMVSNSHAGLYYERVLVSGIVYEGYFGIVPFLIFHFNQFFATRPALSS